MLADYYCFSSGTNTYYRFMALFLGVLTCTTGGRGKPPVGSEAASPPAGESELAILTFHLFPRGIAHMEDKSFGYFKLPIHLYLLLHSWSAAVPLPFLILLFTYLPSFRYRR